MGTKSLMQRTYLFDDFFESGMDAAASPFLTPSSRSWGRHLSLKTSLLSAFLLILSFFCSFFPAFSALSNLFLLFTYFLAGIPALIASIEDIVNFQINIDVLMTLAAFGAVLIGSGKEGALLLVLFSISGAMEEAVATRAKGAISAIRKLAPTKAHVVSADGSLVQKAIDDIQAGTVIHVKVGEIIPLDGQIISGASSINLVHLTGENLPQTKKEGDEVPSGGLALDGALTLKVTHTSHDSTLARIIKLITEASVAKPKLQRWLDKVSRNYAVTIISLAFVFTLTLPWLFSIPFLGLEGAIYRSLAFLIAASPCALIIAIPIAYLSAVGSCAKKGILLKGGVILDALSKCEVLAMDKTGTLTTGELTCTGIEQMGHQTDEEVKNALLLAASLEKNAHHPIASAILAYAETQGLSPNASITHFQALPGLGLQGKHDDVKLALGKAEWILSMANASFQEEGAKRVATIKERGEILTMLKHGESLFLFRFKDKSRTKVKKTLSELKEKFKFKFLMLTGDHDLNASFIAKEVGIEKTYANLRPEDKLKIIGEIAKKTDLAMVGDGINDAPALARAHVGIAMGKVGSGMATKVADIVLLQDNFEHLAWLVGKAKKTQVIVKENLLIALGTIILVTLPALLGFIPLWLAVLLHEGGTVIVGLNSLRLLKK